MSYVDTLTELSPDYFLPADDYALSLPEGNFLPINDDNNVKLSAAWLVSYAEQLNDGLHPSEVLPLDAAVVSMQKVSEQMQARFGLQFPYTREYLEGTLPYRAPEPVKVSSATTGFVKVSMVSDKGETQVATTLPEMNKLSSKLGTMVSSAARRESALSLDEAYRSLHMVPPYEVRKFSSQVLVYPVPDGVDAIFSAMLKKSSQELCAVIDTGRQLYRDSVMRDDHDTGIAVLQKISEAYEDEVEPTYAGMDLVSAATDHRIERYRSVPTVKQSAPDNPADWEEPIPCGDTTTTRKALTSATDGAKSERIKEILGEGFADFKEDPVAVFKSMPAPVKVQLAEVANG